MKTLPSRIEIFRQLLKPGSVVAEVGVYKGWFASDILQCPNVAKYYGVDAWRRQVWSKCEQAPDEDHEANYQEAVHHTKGFGDRCTLLRMTSTEAAKSGLIPPLDLVFLDACHEYDAVTEDLTVWSKLLKPTGMIAGHDFEDPATHPDAKLWGFGVIEAVAEFCETENWEIGWLTEENFKSYVLVPKVAGEGEL